MKKLKITFLGIICIILFMSVILISQKKEKIFPYENLKSMKNSNAKLEYKDDKEYNYKELNYYGLDLIVRWFNVKDDMSYQGNGLPQEWIYKITFYVDSTYEEIIWITKNEVAINNNVYIYTGKKDYMNHLLEILEFVYEDDRFGAFRKE